MPSASGRGRAVAVLVAAAGLAGVAVLGGCTTSPASAAAGAGAPNASTGATPAASTPSSSPADTGQPGAAPSPTATSTSRTPSGGTPTACGPEHLTAGKVQGGAAAGTAGYTIQLTNHGGTKCTLPAIPKLYYSTAGGSFRAIPVTSVPGTTSLALAPGRTAETNVLIVDGYGGYATDSPHCVHPVVYRGISLQVGDGRIALPHFELDVTCDGVRVAGWNFAQ